MTRLDAFCKLLGWQGGTIHQIAAVTGCRVDDLLYCHHIVDFDSFDLGWADAACNRATGHKGNMDYWHGACVCLQENSAAA